MIFLVCTLFVSVIVGIATGGALANATQVRIRYLPLVVAAVVVQVCIFSTILGQNLLVHRIGPYLHMGTVLVPLAVMLVNRNVPGMKLVLLGAALNAIVIIANAGFMPISKTSLEIAGRESEMIHHSARHVGEDYILSNGHMITDETNLRLLSDIIPIPEGVPISSVISIGDVILAIGVGSVVLHAMYLPQRRAASRERRAECVGNVATRDA